MASGSSVSLDAQLTAEATSISANPSPMPVVVPEVDLVFKPNNLLGLFDLTKGKEYLQPARDFMLNCPLKKAFTINPKPDKRLLLQLWSTAAVVREQNAKGTWQEMIKFQINDEILTFGIATIRNILEIVGKKKYPSAPSKEEILNFLDSIGYRWPEKDGIVLKNPSTVKKSGLNATFYYIWNTFGLCLTGKTGSTEQFPTTIQQMVFSAIKNRRFDYVGAIWEDMLSKVKDSKRTPNIPFIRFFSAVLELHMKQNYPTDGTFNNYAISLKLLDQVQPTPEDVPLSAVLVLPPPPQDQPFQDSQMDRPVPPPHQGMFSNISSKPPSSSSMHAMSVANPILTSPAATTTSSLLKRPPPSGSSPSQPLKRIKSKVQKKGKGPVAGNKYYLTLPKLFNKPSPLSHTSKPADAAATTAPAVTNEPEVVHLDTSEDQAGNRLDANPTSGNKFKQFIPSSSSSKKALRLLV